MHFNYLTYLACGSNLSHDDFLKAIKIRDKIKNGNPNVLEKLVNSLKSSGLVVFFNDACLVPAPKSSKELIGAMKPSKLICEALVSAGIGSSTIDILKRTITIRKSSSCNGADERPSVNEHLDTISVNPSLIPEHTIIVIDDVLSLGRTTLACAKKLQKVYPDKLIKIFAPVKSSNFDNHSEIVHPMQGKIVLNPNTGKTFFD